MALIEWTSTPALSLTGRRAGEEKEATSTDTYSACSSAGRLASRGALRLVGKILVLRGGCKSWKVPGM